MKKIIKVLKSVWFWIGVCFVGWCLLARFWAFPDESISDILHRFFPASVLLETLVSVSILMFFIGIVMGIVFLLDKKKNGKFREDVKVGDKTFVSTGDFSREGEVVEIDGNDVYVKLKFSKNSLIKPKV